MPDIRERKQGDKVKGKERGGKHVKKDARRSMTVKLQKELAERTRNRDSGGNTNEALPEAQAVEQVEESAVNLVGGVRERTGGGVSKAVTHGKRLIHEKRKHAETPAEQTPPPAEDAAPPIRERAEYDRQAAQRPDPKTREAARSQAGTERKPPAPQERMRHMAIKERQNAPKKRPASAPVNYSNTAPQPSPAPPAPQERMRSAAIKKRKNAPKERPASAPVNYSNTASQPPQAPPAPQERMRSAAIKERRNAPKGRPASAPVNYSNTAPRPSPAQPTPQERMRSTTIKERQSTPTPRPAPAPFTEKNGVSFDNQSINPINPVKERHRRSLTPKGKPAGGASVPKTRGSAAPAAPVIQKAHTTATGKAATQQAVARARQRVQRNAQRQLFQRSQRAAKRTANLSRKAAAVVVKAVSSAIGAIAGLVGGSVIIPAVMVIILVAAILASPFGVLFSNEPTPGAVPLNVAVGQLNMELSDTLEDLQNGDYDSIDIQGTGPDWCEVVAVFAAKTAGAADGVDVAALTPDRVDRLRAVFWDMCAVTSEVEEIDHPGEGDDEGWTEYILHITITAKSADDMRTDYTLTDYQNKALTELLAELATMELLLTDLTAQTEQARELLKNLPDNLDSERRAVVENACKLVGKVSYFWGGKSLVLGWDSRWGTIQKVWADGNSTTGCYLPYGLDCSGFVDWVFYNATNGAYVIGHGGGATMQHSYCTPISWNMALPGDLVFYPEDSHVGIVGGRDEDGTLLIVHCAFSYNNVVITGADGFTAIGRPQYYAAH